MSDEGVPEWIVERAEETHESTGIPFHEALQVEIQTALMWYGEITERDPVKEAKRQKALQFNKPINPERFYE